MQGQEEGHPDEATAAAGEGLSQWGVTCFNMRYILIVYLFMYSLTVD
jgi:hypothetical protein